MSAGQFIETLRRIGYPKANTLDPQALEWAFELDATRPFLEWFCHSISGDNVVSSEEIEEYSKLKEDGNVFRGSQLEEALKTLTEIDTTTDNSEADLKKLRESVAKAKVQKNALMARCNKLSVHHLALRNRATKMEEVEEQGLKACHQMMDHCSILNGKIGEALVSLTESVERITCLYKKPTSSQGEGNKAESCSHFLSQVDLKAFLEAEEKFSHDLTAFTKKQFCEGIADIAGDKDTDQYDLVDVSSPEKMVAKGKEKESFFEDCQEFSRLQKMYGS